LEPIGRVGLKRRLVLGVFEVALGNQYRHGKQGEEGCC
jgi:hypothetical protein